MVALAIVMLFALSSANTDFLPPLTSTNPCGFPHFLQCDSKWADTPLGFSSEYDICNAGCALTSTSMVVAKHHGESWGPDKLNYWLKDNGGFQGADIVWSAVSKIGPEFKAEDHIGQTMLDRDLPKCAGFIANVRGGTHWVLLTSKRDDHSYWVNDPADFQSYYEYGDMLDIVHYSGKTDLDNITQDTN